MLIVDVKILEWKIVLWIVWDAGNFHASLVFLQIRFVCNCQNTRSSHDSRIELNKSDTSDTVNVEEVWDKISHITIRNDDIFENLKFWSY